jgi:hypothetical protein
MFATAIASSISTRQIVRVLKKPAVLDAVMLLHSISTPGFSSATSGQTPPLNGNRDNGTFRGEYETDMPKCLFCPTEQEHLSQEHVFPAALGGTLELPNAVCTPCNNDFSTFEQVVARELAPIRFVLQIPDRRGEVPRVEATVKTAHREYGARLEGKGKLVMKPIVTEVMGDAGKREFVHQFITARQKQKLEQEAKEKGLEIIETGPGEPEEGEVHFGGELRYLGSSEGLRTAAKIAFVGLAYRAGVILASGDSFQTVRTYIKDGAGTPCARLFSNLGYMDAVQQGPHQHSLTIAGRHDKGRVDAIVRLFGGLCYFVELSTTYGGADFSDLLVFDSYRGELNGMLVAHIQAEMLQIEDVATSAATVWDNLESTGIHFCRFLESAINAKIERNRRSAGKDLGKSSEPQNSQ